MWPHGHFPQISVFSSLSGSVFNFALYVYCSGAHTIPPTTPLTAHLQTTIQGIYAGFYWGLGYGLGALLGGALYASLGARMCFSISTSLPLLALITLAVPTARHWYKIRGRLLRWWIDAASRGRPAGGWWFELRANVCVLQRSCNILNGI